jgi:hypothetical protein
MHREKLRCREFITLLGGAAGSPLAAYTQAQLRRGRLVFLQADHWPSASESIRSGLQGPYTLFTSFRATTKRYRRCRGFPDSLASELPASC